MLLRTSFDLPESAMAARLICSAQGSYDVELNGRKTSDQVLTGGWTVFGKRLLVDESDATSLVNAGRNTINVWLAGGWFTESYGHLGNTTRFYGEQPSFAMRLVVTLASGREALVETGADWWVSDQGPLVSSSIYQGEEFDARLFEDESSESSVADWIAAAEVEVEADLQLRSAPPVRRTGELAVVSHVTGADGRIILDFGQNHAGRLRIRVTGDRGQLLTIRHAEVLEDGELATRPLRYAAAIDTYTLAGNPEGEILEPRFTFHGYRYAEISGWPGDFDPAAVTSIVLQSDLRPTGRFASSHDQLNRLHDNVLWSTKSNFLAIPTDCPQRDERLGWTGDIQVFAPTSSFLYDDNAFLQSWLVDLVLEQESRGGRVPVIVPDPINDIRTPAAAWGDAATVVPWTLYERYGDTSVLERQLPSMKAWVECVWERATDGLWTGDFQFGDWLDPSAPPDEPALAMTDPDVVATAYLYRSASLTANAAELVGTPADVQRYRDIASTVKSAFLTAFAGVNSQRLTADSPTAYALAIVFGLTRDERQRLDFGDRLAELMRRGRHRIQTGFVGTPIICDALTDTGHHDDAEKLIFQTANPSWLYSVTMGATTIWERWDSLLEDGSVNPGEMTSFNHYALGAVADWLHRRVAGLAPATPGYRVLKIEPIFLDTLDWAEADLDTVYGQASSRWERQDDHTVRVRITVPANATAEVRLPGWKTSVSVGSGTHEWSLAVV